MRFDVDDECATAFNDGWEAGKASRQAVVDAARKLILDPRRRDFWRGGFDPTFVMDLHGAIRDLERQEQ